MEETGITIETKYLTPEHVAARYQICLATVHRKLRRGEIRALRIGHLWRIPEFELERYEKSLIRTGVSN